MLEESQSQITQTLTVKSVLLEKELMYEVSFLSFQVLIKCMLDLIRSRLFSWDSTPTFKKDSEI